MMASEQKCKLCTKYVERDEFADLDDEILEKMEFLKIDLVGISCISSFRLSNSNNFLYTTKRYIVHAF